MPRTRVGLQARGVRNDQLVGRHFAERSPGAANFLSAGVWRGRGGKSALTTGRSATRSRQRAVRRAHGPDATALGRGLPAEAKARSARPARYVSVVEDPQQPSRRQALAVSGGIGRFDIREQEVLGEVVQDGDRHLRHRTFPIFSRASTGFRP